MTVLRLFLVCSLLWLAGCATQQGGSMGPTLNPDSRLKPLSTTQLASGKVASLEPPQDLWERIRNGFAMPDLVDEQVSEREQWYSSRPDYILRMTERSKKYLFHIVEELERRNMPTELALLPYIESAFNPQAVSSAKAAGMWQFMPATGTYFDLKQNMLRDDRRDVLASTRAALDYLQKLHRMFGDWHLALAAYNWGEGSVSRAIKRNQKAGLGTSYLELNLPAETRQYVPKLQAVKNIIARPEDFDTELPVIENHPFFQVVDIDQDMDAEVVAQLADISLADFRALNPSLNKPVIFAAATPQILLPWDNAKVFEQNLYELRTGTSSVGKLASWTVWTVPTTMSVADIAKRVGTDEAQLRQANNIPPRMLIKAGSALMVPRTQALDQDVAQHIANSANLNFTPEYSLANHQQRTVRVQRGDTLLGLARRHKVSVSQLASWNKLSTKAQLRIGQTLRLYAPAAARPTAQTPRRQAQQPPRRQATPPVKRNTPTKGTPRKRAPTPTKRR